MFLEIGVKNMQNTIMSQGSASAILFLVLIFSAIKITFFKDVEKTRGIWAEKFYDYDSKIFLLFTKV